MHPIERQKTQPPEQPVAADEAPCDDEGEGPEDQHHADIEFKAQGRPWRGEVANIAAGFYVHRLYPAQASHGAAIDISKGVPAFKPVKPLAPFKGKLCLRQGVDQIMPGKAAQDAFKAQIIQRGHRLIVNQRANKQARQIKGHDVL